MDLFEIRFDLSTKHCKAKNAAGITCSLDDVHNDLGNSHMSTEQGAPVYWKDQVAEEKRCQTL